MCLILFSYKQHPFYPLVLAANRDEFYERPTAPASFWEDRSDLLAGRDLERNGTWFGITRQGRMAALTNYRDPATAKRDVPSRGWLVRDFLVGGDDPETYLQRLTETAYKYNGYSLILGDPFQLYYFSNHSGTRKLSPGPYGLSNHLLDTPWPKVERGKKLLAELLSKKAIPQPEDIFDLLKDQQRPPDELLPDTGVGPEWERRLSTLFIASPIYGTRSSTLLLIDRCRRVTFMERTFSGGPDSWMTAKFLFKIGGDAHDVET